MIKNIYIRIVPLVFLSIVAFSSVSNVYAGELSNRLELVEAKLAEMDCMSDRLERIERDETNEAVLREYFRRLGAIDIDGAAELFHEDMVLEMPTSPEIIAEHSPRKVAGKDAVVKYYQEGLGTEAESADSVSVILHSIRHLEEPDTIVFEYNEKGTLRDGKTFELDVLSIIRFKDGKIIHLVEYMDPLTMMEAFAPQSDK